MSKESRLNGLVAAMMLGDCLGTPCVFMKSEQILHNAAQASWNLGTPGMCSSILMTAIAAIKRYGCDMHHLAAQYQKWARQTTNELDLITCRCFAQKKKQSLDTLYAKSETSDHGALCSGLLLVRQIPIVLAHTLAAPQTLFQAVEMESRMTHVDPISIECAQIYALCLQGILNGKSRTQIWDSLFQAIQSHEVYRIVMNSYYRKPVCDNREYSQACTALGIALYHYWHDTPFVSAVRSAVLAGGATDVNATVTAALSGTSQGYKAIPTTWLETLIHPDPSKTIPQLTVMLKLAADIAIHSGYLPIKYKLRTRALKSSPSNLLAA